MTLFYQISEFFIARLSWSISPVLVCLWILSLWFVLGASTGHDRKDRPQPGIQQTDE
jgi:hypothetical protein